MIIKGLETGNLVAADANQDRVVRDRKKLECDIKAIIESIVEITAYPKQIL